MEGSSSQETSLVPSEPSTESEHSAMLDSSGSSVELELAGEENKDLEKYTRRYEEGYNICMTHNIMHGCNALTLPMLKAWYQTAVKIGSVSGEESATGEPGN